MRSSSTWRPDCANGADLLYARVLFAGQRENGRPHPPGHGQARRPLDRGSHQFHRLAHLSAATGGRSSIIRSCISSCATTRPSSTRLRTSFRLSRRARRASARSARLYAGDDPIRRITSPTPGCGGRSPITCARARLCGGCRRRTCRDGALSQGFGDRSAITTARGLPREGDVEIRTEQYLRQDPRRMPAHKVYEDDKTSAFSISCRVRRGIRWSSQIPCPDVS